MPAIPTENKANQVALETSDYFVKSFYRCMENSAQRSLLASWFTSPEILDAGSFPLINFNGSVLNAVDFQKMVEEFPPTRFEVSSFDTQVINPAVVTDGRTDDDAIKGKNVSICILVSGSMHIGRKEDNNKRVFSDSFILVPNKKVVTGRRERGHKEWLLQVYQSRVVSN